MKSIHLATLGCAALLALTPAQAQEPTTGGHIIALPQTPNTLVGTWRVTVSPDGIPPFRAYNIFYADGNSIEFDNSNAPGGQTIASGPGPEPESTPTRSPRSTCSSTARAIIRVSCTCRGASRSTLPGTRSPARSNSPLPIRPICRFSREAERQRVYARAGRCYFNNLDRGPSD